MPDTALLGQNHLADHGVEATIHRPSLRRTERVAGLRHRVTWNLRELALPWELGDADVVCTPLTNLLPVTSRIRRRPRVMLFNYGLVTLWRRSRGLRRLAVRGTLTASSWVLCVGSEQLARTRELPGVDASRTHLVELGVDGRFYKPTPLPADGYVLAIGRDLARDYATFARAVDGLAAKVVLITEPRNIAGVALPDNVEYIHRVPPSGLQELYAGARCVVLPLYPDSRPEGTEGSGLTALLEAMATARPIVASERAVFRDYVAGGESALLVPPGDPQALRETIERTLGDSGLSERLGSRARQEVDARLSTVHLAGRLAGILRA